ncbi:hypothetical protein WICMUC_002866 [Wickerhamomyces mucosus]|uniref:Uncharacterized protein n=1 Tax=Wickerhamomyces mucosus TaxID=1378264 RepID=A0A9P8TDR6_9ASCO|nr:hypothetical protein WICMUC_002866 [Wickerhamomyces mucosus]
MEITRDNSLSLVELIEARKAALVQNDTRFTITLRGIPEFAKSSLDLYPYDTLQVLIDKANLANSDVSFLSLPDYGSHLKTYSMSTTLLAMGFFNGVIIEYENTDILSSPKTLAGNLSEKHLNDSLSEGPTRKRRATSEHAGNDELVESLRDNQSSPKRVKPAADIQPIQGQNQSSHNSKSKNLLALSSTTRTEANEISTALDSEIDHNHTQAPDDSTGKKETVLSSEDRPLSIQGSDILYALRVNLSNGRVLKATVGGHVKFQNLINILIENDPFKFEEPLKLKYKGKIINPEIDTPVSLGLKTPAQASKPNTIEIANFPSFRKFKFIVKTKISNHQCTLTENLTLKKIEPIFRKRYPIFKDLKLLFFFNAKVLDLENSTPLSIGAHETKSNIIFPFIHSGDRNLPQELTNILPLSIDRFDIFFLWESLPKTSSGLEPTNKQLFQNPYWKNPSKAKEELDLGPLQQSTQLSESHSSQTSEKDKGHKGPTIDTNYPRDNETFVSSPAIIDRTDSLSYMSTNAPARSAEVSDQDYGFPNTAPINQIPEASFTNSELIPSSSQVIPSTQARLEYSSHSIQFPSETIASASLPEALINNKALLTEGPSSNVVTEQSTLNTVQGASRKTIDNNHTEGSRILVTIILASNQNIFQKFSVLRGIKLTKAYKKFETRTAKTGKNSLDFYFNGALIKFNDTTESLKLGDEALIYAYPKPSE